MIQFDKQIRLNAQKNHKQIIKPIVKINGKIVDSMIQGRFYSIKNNGPEKIWIFCNRLSFILSFLFQSLLFHTPFEGRMLIFTHDFHDVGPINVKFEWAMAILSVPTAQNGMLERLK